MRIARSEEGGDATEILLSVLVSSSANPDSSNSRVSDIAALGLKPESRA